MVAGLTQDGVFPGTQTPRPTNDLLYSFLIRNVNNILENLVDSKHAIYQVMEYTKTFYITTSFSLSNNANNAAWIQFQTVPEFAASLP
jgi:hypothetical protein